MRIFSKKKNRNDLLKNIQITDSAQKYIENLLFNKPGAQIRIFVIQPGTPYARCGLSLYFPKEKKTTDFKLKFKKFCVYIDKSSASFLSETKIDLVPRDSFSYQLKLITPNIQKRVIKKENKKIPHLLFTRVSSFLEECINPQLSIHGGKIHLLKIDKEMKVFIEFIGGCNGCHLASLTFKEKITKELMKNFPEISEVLDATDHKYGKHSFL